MRTDYQILTLLIEADEAGDEEQLKYLGEVMQKLSLFAASKCFAVRSRLGGAIQSALAHEAEAEKVWQTLPDEVKW